ncbi:hypothetical protein [Streptomyces uncialis]|uniref:hypothetical protein n=1 Tax=Streptomyces uncialis TaxID=1048205 RepID=UPI0038636972|nr:hypothetical protein OG924_01100 [Streptomyces uncialis]
MRTSVTVMSGLLALGLSTTATVPAAAAQSGDEGKRCVTYIGNHNCQISGPRRSRRSCWSSRPRRSGRHRRP